jgi:glycosyltransferase involved in cell wall biosynthesis
MVSALLLKLNGWPETFNERAEAIASHVDELVVIRPKPIEKADSLTKVENIRTYDLYPQRGSFVEPGWLKPVIFPLHVLQAVLLMIYLLYRGRLPPVIHALDYALGGMAGAVVSRLFSVPFVVSVRGLKEPRYRALLEEEQTLRASVSYRILRVMTGFVLTNADYVVTKAEYQIEFVQETFGVDPGFISVPTGVDFDVFDSSKPHNEHITEILDISNENLTEDDDVVLYLAKLLPEKGPDQVLRLVNQADDRLPPDIKFVFVGEFRDASFEQEFHELQHAVSERTVLYPQRVSFNDVSRLLNSADAVVLLSKSGTEGVPRILQESCAIQTPLVASNVTGIAGAFDDLPGCYLISRDDPQEFISAISQAVTDSPQMPREVFADRFDIYKNYAKYAEVYKTLATSNQSV